MTEHYWTMTKIVLALLVILVLLVFPSKIYSAVKSITTLTPSTQEPADITQKRTECNNNYANNLRTNNCALELASMIADTNGNLFEAESWLQKQITDPTTSQEILSSCFKFARDILYPASNDYVGAVKTYDMLLRANLAASDIPKVQLAKDEAELRVNVPIILDVYKQLNERPTLAKMTADSSKTMLVGTVKSYFDAKEQDPNLQDVPLLGSCDILRPSSVLCNYERESLAKGCYQVQLVTSSTPCGSCPASTSSTCSTYYAEGSCETDPCNLGDCKWVQGTCKDVSGTSNYWDLS